METFVDRVRQVVPTTDVLTRFDFDEDAKGHVIPIEQLAGYRHRVCDFRVLTFPVDDLEAGFTTARFRANMGLRVLYDAQRDRAQLERIMAEDTAILVQALQDIAAWDSSVVSVVPPSAPTVEQRMGDNPDPQLLGFILTIPFDLVYLSSGP